jgi:hypothetical protein
MSRKNLKLRTHNIVPGNIRGRKDLRSKRGLMPNAMDWRGNNYGFWRHWERVPGGDRNWYKPLNRISNKREKRGQSKPR